MKNKFDKLYIKFTEGDKESLNRAVKEADRLGYKKLNVDDALYFKGKGILKLYKYGEYFTSTHTGEKLIAMGYKEHKMNNELTQENVKKGLIIECIDDSDSYGYIHNGEEYMVYDFDLKNKTITIPYKGGWNMNRFILK